jgi:hypothetical protein
LGQSIEWKHCTHFAAWQIGVAWGQSLFAWQTTHEPSAQILPGCDAQSTLEPHWAHDEVAVSQIGASPEQLELLVHPERQWKSLGSQIGADAPQSELLRHCTHWPWAGRHRGASMGQSLFCAHSTHCSVVESQILLPLVQSADDWHPTQAPALVLQSGVFFGQAVLVVHAA